MSKVIESLERIKTKIIIETEIRVNKELCVANPYYDDYLIVQQALQRLDEYEQILGNGRLTDRNYKNTTLDLDSCKPYLRLGQLEDIYEKGK